MQKVTDEEDRLKWFARGHTGCQQHGEELKSPFLVLCPIHFHLSIDLTFYYLEVFFFYWWHLHITWHKKLQATDHMNIYFFFRIELLQEILCLP